LGLASSYSVSRNELPITYLSSVAFCHLSRFSIHPVFRLPTFQKCNVCESTG
jgi:hypothetical protein